jgi:predicted RND superfamily exporter protein
MRRNREALLSPLASPVEAEAIRLDPLNLREIVQDALRARLPRTRLDLSTGYYLDRSHRFALVMARPRGSARDMSYVRGLYREVSRIAARAAEGGEWRGKVRIGLAGGYARAAEAISVIWHDMLVSFALSFCLVLLILCLAFRPSAVVLGIFVVTLLTSLAWTLLLAYVLYGTLNIITSIVAAMLIGMFVDYMIHTYRRFEELYRLEGATLPALSRTLTGTGKAILSGALTTAISFFSIVVTGFRGLHELGIVAGFGIFFCLVATLVLMTSLLTWLARAHPERLLAGRPADVGGEWAAGLVERRGRLLAAGFAILAVVGVVGAARVRFDTGLESLGLRDSAVQTVETKIADLLERRGEPLFVVARAEGEARLAADFDRLEALGDQWRAAGRVGGFSSLAALLPPPARQRNALARLAGEGLADGRSGPDLARQIRQAMERQGLVADASLEAYAAGVARALASREVVGFAALLRAQDPRAAYYYSPAATAIAAHLTSPGPRWDQQALSALAEEVRRLGPDFRLVGPAMFLGELQGAILWQAGAAVLLSFAANLLVVWLHFRLWRRVWLVMLPVTMGTVLTVGTMGILGVRFNFFNVAGIALIFGFGVDYGVYLMQAHVEEGSRGAAAVRAVGGNIVLCALTTVVSCGSLITSHYGGLASIGAVLCLGAGYCLAGALLLLPALLMPCGRADGSP